MRHLLASTLVLLLLSTTGCFQYEESLELKADGSGRATTRVLLPKPGATPPELVKTFETRMDWGMDPGEVPQGIAISRQTTEQDGRLEIKTIIAFDDVRKLTIWPEQSPFSNVVVTLGPDALDFSRRFAAVSDEKLPALGDDVKIVFSLTGPGSVASHNGTRVSGTTVYWDVGLRELLGGKGKTLGAKFVFGAPYGIYVLVVVLAVLAAAVHLFLRRRGTSQG